MGKRKCRRGNTVGGINEIGNISDLEDVEKEIDALFLGSITSKNRTKKRKIEVYVLEFGKSLEFLIDTGADVTCTPDKYIELDDYKKILLTEQKIYTYDGREMKILGFIDSVREIGKKQVKERAYVIKKI